ncbi:hypothetical protein HF521_006026 [Silurus meridionalis]|uniref:MIF4G domain-containing protein n=1 Tax=Silurus meridionalis TaxID=175797 RepID=A0A8T0AUM0_SILME|nr:hypothetical protein HF521_006026 [Silurus meridionalis]
MYSGTYVPVVMNMPAGSPEEQMLYYYGAPFYVMPPQQYSVHPTGLNTFYNVLPGPTSPTNGMLYYNDQDVHNQTQFPMIPPLQQHPTTMRKRKTIIVRDPNQDHKDITEEIILEAGRSRKPTLPVGNDFSVPVPLQQLDQLVENEHVYYVDRAQGPPAPADLEPDEQLESYSVPYAALDGAEKHTSSAEPGPAQAITPTPDKTEPVQVPPEVPASVLFAIDKPAESDTAPRPDDSQFLREDKPELAFQQSDFDLEPVSTTVENYSVSPVIVQHLASAETPADEIVEQKVELLKNEPEPSSGDESNDGVLSPVEEPKTTPCPDKPELAFQQSDFDLEPVSTTVETYSVSPVIVEHLASAETPADEIVEQEAEPPKNEPEPSSEDESNDGVLSPVEDPINNTMHKPEMENKRIQYGREFLLRMQFMPDCMQKPEGLPFIPDVVLRKCNQNRLPPDPQRLISRDPFFIPAFADNRSMIPNEKRAPQPNAIWRRPPPNKFLLHVPMNEEVKLKKAENAWKPRIKSSNSTEDLETQKTEKLFRTVRSILNKLTPEMFDQLMKQVKELHIDTEERLKGVVNLIFENAIDEPNFSMGYGIMCKSLAAINVPMANKPHSNVNFQRLLLHRCQKEFDKDKTSNDVLDKKQRELEAAVSASERERLQDELEEAKNKTRRKTKGNVKFIGELFKLRLLTESIIHNCVVKLLKKNDEESLECLSILLTTAGKEMDVKKAKVQMDKYFKKMEEIVKGKKTSSRVRFMLQDVIYLRLNNWVPRRVVEGPKTIESIHMDAKWSSRRSKE